MNNFKDTDFFHNSVHKIEKVKKTMCRREGGGWGLWAAHTKSAALGFSFTFEWELSGK
uniref:Uncharacterized protein n=1 Tax=Anguilla anguilla TaxID=7936 RepID=A0A0E9VGN5_ANGAN